MKKTLLISCVCMFISFISFSHVIYLADTAFTTDVGFGGAPASCIAPHMEYDGWQMARVNSTWLADAFTVPTDSTWAFDTVFVYGYQRNSGTTSTFTGCNLQIYNGAPGHGGSVIWGDTTTNVLSGTGFTGIYRVDTITADGGLTTTQRPIMYLKLYLSSAPHLSGGTYWLSWSATGSLAIVPSSPDKVLPGRINPTGQQGMQLFSGNWNYINDSGNSVGLNKIIKASAAVASVANVTKSPVISLSQNTPNPFKGSTEISFYTPQAGGVKLSVYNSTGQLVNTLVDGYLNTGKYTVTFDASKLSPGIYYYQLNTNAATESKEMIVK